MQSITGRPSRWVCVLALCAALGHAEFTKEVKLTIGDQGARDFNGRATAISGDTVVVGAPFDDNVGADSGSAYVFKRTGNTWTQQQKLTASDAAAGDQFGWGVDIDGGTLVVGLVSGAAYVFRRNGTAWTEEQKLTASDADGDFDQFGAFVGISGDTIVIGAPLDDDPEVDSGSAYVFTRRGTTWTETQKLPAHNLAAGHFLGFPVAIHGNTIVVGAFGDDHAGFATGAVYVYARTGATWTEQQRLTASDAMAEDVFGWGVSVSANTIAVGARKIDGVGAAYVYTRSGTAWTEQQKLTAGDGDPDGDFFGWSVDIHGNTLVVTAIEDDSVAKGAGAAYVFTCKGTTWTERQRLTASDGAAFDNFGHTVALSGGTAVLGTNNNEAYVVRR